MSEETEETAAPEYPFDWMPLEIGGVEIVSWDGHSYVDRAGRTYWSGEAEPSADDAKAAVETPRTPPAPVPAEISRAEFIIALRKVLGLQEGDVFAIISHVPKGEVQEDARDLWEHARVFRRHNRFLLQLAEMEGIKPAQLDEVFRVGHSLNLD